MITILKNTKYPEKRFGTGAYVDQKDERDFLNVELGIAGAGVPPIWEEKTPDKWRKFPIFNQIDSFSCVGQTVAKVLGVENFLEDGHFVQFSAKDIYSRGFQPLGGMFYRDGIDIGYKFGATLEQLMPSQKIHEPEMRDASKERTVLTEQIALVGKGGNYFSIPERDIDALAAIIATGKAICFGTRFNPGQWATGEVKLHPAGQYGHAIALVDFTLWKGQKALVFDNSWDYSWGFNGQGVLTQDQLAGATAAWYYAALANNWRDTIVNPDPATKPKYKFNNDLKVGMKNNDVLQLQNCLRYDGEFPKDPNLSTGYFGGVTLDAVKKFQAKYGIDTTGFVGAITRAKLNEIFS